MSGCRICKRPLTSQKSIEKGIGSDCVKLVGSYVGDQTIDIDTYPRNLQNPLTIKDPDEQAKAVNMRIIEQRVALNRRLRSARKWRGSVSDMKGEEGNRSFTASSSNNKTMDGYELVARAQIYAEETGFVHDGSKLKPLQVTNKSGRVCLTFESSDHPDQPCLRMIVKENKGSGTVKYFFNEIPTTEINDLDETEEETEDRWWHEDYSSYNSSGGGSSNKQNIFEWICGWAKEGNGRGR